MHSNLLQCFRCLNKCIRYKVFSTNDTVWTTKSVIFGLFVSAFFPSVGEFTILQLVQADGCMNRIVAAKGDKYDTFGGPYCTYISVTTWLQAQSALEVLIYRLYLH